MCIVRVLTDVRLITITTIATIKTHASGMFSYCCINKTIQRENYIGVYYNYIYYLTHEASGTTLEWMSLGLWTRAGTINKSDMSYYIESEWGFFKRVVPLKYEVAQTLSARRTLYYRETITTMCLLYGAIKGLKKFCARPSVSIFLYFLN